MFACADDEAVTFLDRGFPAPRSPTCRFLESFMPLVRRQIS